MAIRDQITHALDSIPNLREYDRFQEMAFVLARGKWPGLRLTRKTSDRGADAVDEESALSLACGWSGDLQKLRDDCKRLSDERPEIKKVVFATSLAIDEIQIKGWREKIKREFMLDLVAVMHRDWIIGELTLPENRWIAHEFLELSIGDFADLKTHLPSIASAALRLIDAWKAEHSYRVATLIDLRIGDRAGGSEIVLRRKDLAAAIHVGALIALLGAPGAGKTHSLLSLADDIHAAHRFVPVLVSLRRWGEHGGRLLDFIISEPAFRQQGVRVETFATAVEAGKVLLLLNGWNEVSDAQRRRIQNELRTIQAQFPATACVITARALPSLFGLSQPRVLTLAELAEDEIREVIRRAGITDDAALMRKIKRVPRVLALAKVPLFLRELIAEASSGRDLPATRYGVLKAMVARATEEHRQLLEEAGFSGSEDRYLGRFAWKMTEHSVTGLPTSAARTLAKEVSGELAEEGLLALEPSPAAALERLSASHLLVLEQGGTQITFTHQLVQEYFAAVELARRLRGTDGENATRIAISQWQWTLPIAMGIEKLSSERDAQLAATLLRAWATVDFENSCLALAVAPELWPYVRETFRAGIDILVRRPDVNANWLGARWAAATGQSEFSGIVIRGLSGHPPGSESCFSGLPSESLSQALGPAAADELLGRYDSFVRLRALNDLAADGGRAAIPLAAVLATRDPDLENRLRAFEILFLAGEEGWLRPFIDEVRRQGGWSLRTVLVAKSSPQCSLPAWRRRISRLRNSTSHVRDRIQIQSAWLSRDREGAREDAIHEYEWCGSHARIQPEELQTTFEYRRRCLRRGANTNPAWAATRIAEDLTIGDLEKLGSLPLKVLSPSDRVALVQRLILEAARRDEPVGRRTELLADLAPAAAARTVLKALCDEPNVRQDDHTLATLVNAVAKIPRDAIIAEICRSEYDQLSLTQVGILIDALMRGRDSVALQVLPANVREKYRRRLHEWRALLPTMAQETAHLWADLALLFGEVGAEADVPAVIELLKRDRQRVIERQAERQAAVVAYIASNRTSTPPGPHDACSYEPIYHQSLFGFSGSTLVQLFSELLSEPGQVGFAAHWLADHFGAPRADASANTWSEKKYQLVPALSGRSAEFIAQTGEVVKTIRGAVDRELTGNLRPDQNAISGALVAIARFQGAGAAEWLTPRLERHCENRSCDDILEQIMIVGCTLERARLLPFVTRTIAEARTKDVGQGDQSYRIVRSLAVLFYSDAADAAVQILRTEPRILPDYAFRILLTQIRWARAALIDGWLREMLRDKAVSIYVRAAAAQLLINRAYDAGAVETVVECATWFVSDGDVLHSADAYMLQRSIGEIAAMDEEARAALLAEAEKAATKDLAIGWLKIIPHIGGVIGVLTAFDLAERFGEKELPVIESLAPTEQTDTHLSFSGWAFLMRRVFHFYPEIMSRLFAMIESSDEALRHASRRAILWIERERIQGDSPAAGLRGGHPDRLLRAWPQRVCGDGA